MAKSRFIKNKVSKLQQEIKLLNSVNDEEEYFFKKSHETIKKRRQQLKEAKNQAFDTVALWGLYSREDMRACKSLTLPLFMSTTGGPYESLVDGSLLLSYKTIDDPNKIYTRIDNVNTDHLALKLAALEGLGIPQLTQGFCTSSGMSAIFMATMPFLQVGDNFVSSNRVYGGTQQLFDVTYPKSGWAVRWVEKPWEIDEWEEKIDKKTKFLYAEFPSNPTLFVPDIPLLTKLAHAHNIPFIIDSTMASPALTRPLEHGADIVVHSISKIANGSCRAIGGALVSKEVITTNVESLRENFANKVKGGHFRNMGPCLSPFNAQIIWDELITLRIRVREHSQRAMEIAKFLESHPKIEKVNYPGLKSHPQHQVAKKLMKLPDGTPAYSFLLSFNIKGGFEKARRFAEIFDFGVQVTHLGGSYTVWVHNATTTHGQMTAEERKRAGIADNLIRYSAGLEGAADAISALEKALKQL
jgi:O-acetylhomoserine/O-acetylserine sulfhydrylase-like pyridoxal-dependent enzyme